MDFRGDLHIRISVAAVVGALDLGGDVVDLFACHIV